MREILEKIGLTPGEAEVYEALIELGLSSAGDIIKKANIASSKVYDVLHRLLNKGLASYAIKNNLSILPIFLMILLFNILVIFLIFFFLDFFHEKFLKIKIYRKLFDFYIENRIRKKLKGFKGRYSAYGFLALTLFVAIPFPTTGAWTGTILAWFLGLDRKKSIISISFGVLIAATIMLLASLGIIKLLG